MKRTKTKQIEAWPEDLRTPPLLGTSRNLLATSASLDSVTGKGGMVQVKIPTNG